MYLTNQMVNNCMDAEEVEQRGKILIETLALILEEWIQNASSSNGNSVDEFQQKTKFHAFRAPGISLTDYLLRILKYAQCSSEVFVLSLIYLKRLVLKTELILTNLNIHRLVITSIVIAAKFFDDQYFNNAYYAKVGGIPTEEMNELEVEFLTLINYTLHVYPKEFASFYNSLIQYYSQYVSNPLPPSSLWLCTSIDDECTEIIYTKPNKVYNGIESTSTEKLNYHSSSKSSTSGSIPIPPASMYQNNVYQQPESHSQSHFQPQMQHQQHHTGQYDNKAALLVPSPPGPQFPSFSKYSNNNIYSHQPSYSDMYNANVYSQSSSYGYGDTVYYDTLGNTNRNGYIDDYYYANARNTMATYQQPPLPPQPPQPPTYTNYMGYYNQPPPPPVETSSTRSYNKRHKKEYRRSHESMVSSSATNSSKNIVALGVNA